MDSRPRRGITTLTLALVVVAAGCGERRALEPGPKGALPTGDALHFEPNKTTQTGTLLPGSTLAAAMEYFEVRRPVTIEKVELGTHPEEGFSTHFRLAFTGRPAEGDRPGFELGGSVLSTCTMGKATEFGPTLPAEGTKLRKGDRGSVVMYTYVESDPAPGSFADLTITYRDGDRLLQQSSSQMRFDVMEGGHTSPCNGAGNYWFEPDRWGIADK